ncbi:MAG TPA: hypothetical protein VND93_29600, partial [Myxococcales bacterium]|nr:hypothetical protein [Myxococcales bacterium]
MPQTPPRTQAPPQAQAQPATSPAGSSDQSSFSAGGTDPRRQAQLQGGTSAAQDGNQLIADVSYSKLSSTPEGKQALDDLGITDGQTFHQFADQVAANDAQALQQLDDVMAKASPSFQGQFAAALGALSPEAGITATQAARAQSGNAQAEGWPEGITNADAKQLESWGVTSQQAQESRDALPELLAAAKAAGEANLPAALEHLSNAAQAAPELTARAMAAMTKDMPDGPLKTALNDPAMPGLLGQIAAGDWSGAAATLAGDPALLGAAGEALASLPGVGKLMDKLGISPGDLPSAGAMLPHLFELGAAVTGDPVDVKGATQALLAIAGEVDPDAFGALMGKLGGPLPDAVKSFFAKLAENPQVQAVAKQLMADPNLPALVD